MIKTVFEKAMRIGRATLLLGVIYRRMYKGHPEPVPTATRGMPIRRDLRRSTRMPDLRRLILLSVVSVLATLAVTTSASAATETFTNATPIAIPGSGDIGNASPYPSEIAVSGLSGPITNVAVTLHRFGHGVPSNADILLVSPSGDTVIVMSDACNPATEIEDYTWTFSQQAAGPMTAPCGEFTYRPTNNAGADNFPGAPAGPHGTSFNDFNNENPNGTWKLYVVDDFDEGITGVDDIGDIEGGWTLTIETGPVDVAIPASGTSGPASPYPATRTISGHTGLISDLNVSIDGIWHERPDDLDLLLVGPQGQKVILMSDACGSLGVSAYGWEWDDEAAAPMPEGNGTNVCGTRFHRPANYGSGDVWPAPAPAGPYSTSLSAFDLTNPNGEWRLFVNDDADGNTGFFTNRFQLQIQTVADRDGDGVPDASDACPDQPANTANGCPPPPPNTKPTITNVRPIPASRTRDTTPLIAATVRDAQTNLAKSNIRLFVDGRAKPFSYNAATDRLSYVSRRLSFRGHTVRIVANDGVLGASKVWRFTVIRRR